METYGLYGDRFCAFYDDKRTGWERFVTSRDIPGLLAYRAALREDDICVTSPDGRAFGWDAALLADVQRLSRCPLSMSSRQAAHPENPGLLSVDSAGILIVTDRSLRRLETWRGKELDHRRFRANLIVSLPEGAPDENDWIGRRLAVGDVELRIDEPCERCTVIALDPDTQEGDAALLRIVHEQMGMNFGVYASVQRTGTIRAGDPVTLPD